MQYPLGRGGRPPRGLAQRLSGAEVAPTKPNKDRWHEMADTRKDGCKRCEGGNPSMGGPGSEMWF